MTTKTHLKVTEEIITPDLAARYLENQRQNRNVSNVHVASLATEILRNSFRVTHQGIAFDKDGRLADGQHRLLAIIRAGRPVKMLVFRGLTEEDIEAIDKGRKRNAADELRMFDRIESARNLAANLRVCVTLYARYHNAGQVMINTPGMLREWLKVFEPGVTWATQWHSVSGTAPVFRRAAVAGALAFAHRANPDKINAFAIKVRDGIKLENKEPAWAIRRALLEGGAASLHRGAATTSSEAELRRKVLQAALYDLRGEQLGKVQDSEAGFRYFAAKYEDSRTAKTLLRPAAEMGGGSLTTEQVAEQAHAAVVAKKAG